MADFALEDVEDQLEAYMDMRVGDDAPGGMVAMLVDSLVVPTFLADMPCL